MSNSNKINTPTVVLTVVETSNTQSIAVAWDQSRERSRPDISQMDTFSTVVYKQNKPEQLISITYHDL